LHSENDECEEICALMASLPPQNILLNLKNPTNFPNQKEALSRPSLRTYDDLQNSGSELSCWCSTVILNMTFYDDAFRRLYTL